MKRIFDRSVLFCAGISALGLMGVAIFAESWTMFTDTGPQRALEATVWLLLTALFIVSHKRGVESVRLREKALEGQQLELAFREKALDKHSMVATTAPDGRIKAVNSNFCKVLGYERPELAGHNLSTLMESDQPETFSEILRQTRAGQVWSGELRVLGKDAERRILHTTAVPVSDPKGAHAKTIFLATDMTRQRVVEQQRQLIRCLELLPEDVYMFEMSSMKIIYMNDAAVRRHGWEDGDYRAQAFPEISGDIDTEILRACARRFAEGLDASARFELDCAGTMMEASLQIIDTPDRQKRYVAVLRDISERKAAEETRRNLTSMLTHELRTPLTSIRGAAQLLNSGTVGKLDPPVHSMLNIVEKNSDRLLRLVNDILDLDKLEAGKMEMHMKRLDIGQLIEEAIENDREYASGLGVSFRYSGPRMPLMIEGDRGRLQQVLTNLMSNAAKFSGQGTVVEIGAGKSDTSVRITVSDTGPGIPASARATLFEPFTQLDGHEKSVKGTGLGLTIVKAIVERHGGKVDFRSEEGKGTTFWVDLPLTGAVAATRSESRAA